jgi:hypothetical protein
MGAAPVNNDGVGDTGLVAEGLPNGLLLDISGVGTVLLAPVLELFALLDNTKALEGAANPPNALRPPGDAAPNAVVVVVVGLNILPGDCAGDDNENETSGISEGGGVVAVIVGDENVKEIRGKDDTTGRGITLGGVGKVILAISDDTDMGDENVLLPLPVPLTVVASLAFDGVFITEEKSISPLAVVEGFSVDSKASRTS